MDTDHAAQHDPKPRTPGHLDGCAADNGSSMAPKPVAFLLADLGVTKSHSRPHVSNDCEYGRVATGRSWPL